MTRMRPSLAWLSLSFVAASVRAFQTSSRRATWRGIEQRHRLGPCIGTVDDRRNQGHTLTLGLSEIPADGGTIDTAELQDSRRSLLLKSLAVVTTTCGVLLSESDSANANVGALPEYADTNAVLQSITIKVADPSQQKSMIQFLEDGFDCEVLRKRIVGSVEETWLGFGPEQLSIPTDFTLPVSSFAKYGGHASIHLVYDAKATAPLYTMKEGSSTSTTAIRDNVNIAYVQLGVPTYRISQMVKSGGDVRDAYGYVNVVSPSGLPIRGIVGISPDPIMFVAINCANVGASQAFYERLGFTVQEYPYCRPNKGMGQFEPVQPPRSVYMAPSANGMGVLLLPSKSKIIAANPCVESLNVVYNPSTTATASSDESTGTVVTDPSGVAIAFQSVASFTKEEALTR